MTLEEAQKLAAAIQGLTKSLNDTIRTVQNAGLRVDVDLIPLSEFPGTRMVISAKVFMPVSGA